MSERILSDLGKRIAFIKASKGLENKDLAVIAGVSPQSISNIETGATKNPRGTVLASIASKLSIRWDWLVNGEGEMDLDKADVKQADQIVPIHTFNSGKEKHHESQLVPLYDITASAGLTSIYNSTNNILDYLQIPNLPRCDGAIYVKGDSMYPLLKHGDMVAFQRLVDLPDDIDFGGMYIVDMSTNTLERIFVKYVQKSDKGPDYVKLVSYNSKFHADMDVPLDKIRAMGAVKASIRLS